MATSGFFADTRRCYERWDPAAPAGARLPAAADVPFDGDELEAGGRFGAVTFRRYEHERTYSTREYRELLLTDAAHRAMQPAARAGLLACIATSWTSATAAGSPSAT